jgi:hypothetical protein
VFAVCRGEYSSYVQDLVHELTEGDKTATEVLQQRNPDDSRS